MQKKQLNPFEDEEGKWGFKDKTGNIVIEPQYYNQIHFYKDKYIVWHSDNHGDDVQWGLINSNGKEILPIQYGEIRELCNGLAAINKNGRPGQDNEITGGKWGFINRKGKFAIPLIYDHVDDFLNKEYTIVYLNQKLGILDRSGIHLSRIIYDRILKFNNSNYIFMNIGCENLEDDHVSTIDYYLKNFNFNKDEENYKQNIKHYKNLISSNGKWGIHDIYGLEILPCEYDYWERINNESLKISIGGKSRLVLKNGEKITQFYDLIEYYYNEIFIVKIEKKWALMNSEGIEITLRLDKICNIYNNQICIQNSGKWGILKLGEENQILIDVPMIYESIRTLGRNLVLANRGNKWELIYDYNYKKHIYDDAKIINNFSKLIIIVTSNRLSGVIDNEGNYILPVKYCQIEQDEKYLKVRSGKKWGYYDAYGNEILGINYDEVFPYVSNEKRRFVLKIYDKWGITDENTNEIIPFIYDEIIQYKKEIIGAKIKNKWGVLNQNGDKIIDFIYDDIKIYDRKLIAVKIDGKWGGIDLNGLQKIPFKYEDVCLEDLLLVKMNNTWHYIDSENEDVINISETLIYRYQLSPIKINGKYGLVDRMGQLKIPNIYSFVTHEFKNGLICVNVGGTSNKTYTSTQTNKILSNIDLEWDEDVLKLCSGGKWGVLNNIGNEVIPIEYDSINLCFYKDFTLVNKGGNWEYIEYDDDFTEYFHGGKWGLINSLTFEITLPCIYNEILVYQDGIFAINQNGKWGWADQYGIIKIPAQYEEYTRLDTGELVALRNGSWYIVDMNGKESGPVDAPSFELEY